ncbi:Imidazole glycerol phosphate synthase cyclase subunit [Labilithrix luteola]|uniref:imidazole glycerol-phosphate synthase n=1 Tax=Labilithrix luteola TaxID=1391654 RepID=A0A0K1Q5P4_9BACT|nr:Imidazole glycerol phosphate synthase cyclase subunit [Labilithrix luteola]
MKGVRFDSWRRVGTIMPAVKVYNRREVDELILVDTTATQEQRPPEYAVIEEIAAECFVPLTVGGGVRDIETVRGLLRVGADKVCINTAAYERPELIREAAERFGSQCIVVSIDAKKRDDGTHECYSHSGTVAKARNPRAWAAEVEQLGAGEILLTSIDRDGTMEGYDLELIEQVSSAVRIPVIASGGAGNYRHMHEAVQCNAAAVAAASIFHFTEQTPREAKLFLRERGIAVRDAHVPC